VIRLDAVRAARAATEKALCTELRRAGWILGEPGPEDDERTIGLAELGPWIVIDDVDGEDIDNWPECVAIALDTVGVRMRGYPELGHLYLRRWNGRDVAGTIDANVGPKKVVDASFLGGLATQTKRRGALGKIAMHRVDEAAAAISRTAGLPGPLYTAGPK